MAGTQTGSLQPRAGAPHGSVSTWIVTILVCAYVAWTGVSLYRSTAAFSAMYDSMDGELQGATWFVIHHYRWFFPSLFGSALSLLITKEFFVRRKWISLTITLATAIVIGAAGDGIVMALYAPVNHLGETPRSSQAFPVPSARDFLPRPQTRLGRPDVAVEFSKP